MDVAQVAQAVATALVGAMATDAWGQAARHALVAAGEDARARCAEALVNDLRGQLKVRLRHDLDLAERFDKLATAISEQARHAHQVVAVSQYAAAGDHGTVIQVGHDLIGQDPLAQWRRSGQ